MSYALTLSLFHLFTVFTNGMTSTPDILIKGVCANYLLGFVISILVNKATCSVGLQYAYLNG